MKNTLYFWMVSTLSLSGLLYSQTPPSPTYTTYFNKVNGDRLQVSFDTTNRMIAIYQGQTYQQTQGIQPPQGYMLANTSNPNQLINIVLQPQSGNLPPMAILFTPKGKALSWAGNFIQLGGS